MSSLIRPSPNEEAQMMQEELQRRRKLRILQVREQEKMNAIKIRRAAQEKHEQEINSLAHILEKKWKENREEEIKRQEEKFAACLKDVGSAHEIAKENAPNQALRDAIAEKNQKDAQERGKIALRQQREIQKMQEEESIEKRRKRHVAMIKEKVRAKHIASLPPPTINPADYYLNETTSTKSSSSKSTGSLSNQPGRYATVQIQDQESTMTTTVALGLPSNAVVERATAAEEAVDAREEAVKEDDRIKALQAERDRSVQECMEKARVRHKTALEQARLFRENELLMNDLKHLQMKDGLRRQHHIDYKWDDNSQAKKACQELFGPYGSRFQEREILSRDLQRSSEDAEIPSMLDPASHSSTETTGTSGWNDVSQEEDTSKPGAGRALNRLMKQIEAQRQQKNYGSRSTTETKSNLSADHSPQEEVGKESVVKASSEAKDAETIVEETLAQNYSSAVNDSATIPKGTIPVPTYLQEQPEREPTIPAVSSGNERDSIVSPSKAPKLLQENAPELSVNTTMATDTRQQSKSTSELKLERSLENMRNDEALLKSVKDFQERLLQQHKSSAKIQEQIERLERKREAIDARVVGATGANSIQ